MGPKTTKKEEITMATEKPKKIGVSQKGIDLTKEYEGLRLGAYKDAVGIWTIGYGTTRIDGNSISPRLVISKERAEELLKAGLDSHLEEALGYIRPESLAKMNQNQIDALASFVYNVGVGNFQRSTLLKRINEGRFDDVPAQMAKWNKGRVKGVLTVLRGLSRRRAAEGALWSAK
jgi:lysozyme